MTIDERRKAYLSWAGLKGKARVDEDGDVFFNCGGVEFFLPVPSDGDDLFIQLMVFNAYKIEPNAREKILEGLMFINSKLKLVSTFIVEGAPDRVNVKAETTVNEGKEDPLVTAFCALERLWDALAEMPVLFRKYLPALVLPDETPAEAGNPIH